MGRRGSFVRMSKTTVGIKNMMASERVSDVLRDVLIVDPGDRDLDAVCAQLDGDLVGLVLDEGLDVGGIDEV